MIIDKPGFYASKAGKCEVVAVEDGYAFGFLHGPGSCKWVKTWEASSGYPTYNSAASDEEISGFWVEPRKPVEGEVWVDANNQIIAPTQLPNQWRRVRVREVEDS